jgi:predicted transcriptional regulator
MDDLASTTLTVRVDEAVKERLAKLAQSTGRSRSYLAAEAINEYLDINEWQVAGIKQAITDLGRNGGVPHTAVKQWVSSWGSERRERRRPTPRRA